MGTICPSKPDLADLLRAVDAIEGLDRLRFLTSHPKYMSDRILEAMAELPSVCEHLNLPVQAGDNEVLRRMRRTYTTDLWLDRLAKARELMPGVTVATDIIVGFPGETDEQFQHTLDVLEVADCDKVHVAMYSPRPGTLSARWEDDVPSDVKHARHRAVEELQERVCTARNAGAHRPANGSSDRFSQQRDGGAAVAGGTPWCMSPTIATCSDRLSMCVLPNRVPGI